jgi:hypothetical protein
MKTRKRLLQSLAVLGMAAALGLTSKPAVAATPRICGEMCADWCGQECAQPCFNWSCGLNACATSGTYQPYTVECI